MKTLLLLLTTFYSLLSFSQINQFLNYNQINKLCKQKKVNIKELDKDRINELTLSKIIGLSHRDKLVLVEQKTDIFGSTTIEYTQFRDNIHIYDGLIKILYDINGKLVSINGNWWNKNSDKLITHLNKRKLKRICKVLIDFDDLEYIFSKNKKLKPKYRKVWFIHNNKLKLFWEVKFFMHKSISKQFFIDDSNGKIVLIYDLDNLCDFATVSTAHYGVKNFSCTDYDIGGNYYTVNDCDSHPYWIRVFNNQGNDSYNTNSSVVYSSSDNNWNSSPHEIVGGTTLWELANFDEYLANTFGRNSWDDNNSTWTAYCNTLVNGSPNNAKFSSSTQSVYFGMGNNPNAANDDWNTIDIVGHEVCHGIDYSEGNLTYQDESGALDESFADIFGEILENYLLGTNDWLMASELPNGPIRSFINPHDYDNPSTYLGTYWHFSSSDNGGVHANSGVQNHMFYLLTVGGSGNNDGISYNVNGIGISNSAALAYKVLSDLVTSNTDYNTVRNLWLSAAMSLFPNNTSIYNSVNNAWCAVGVGNSCNSNLPDIIVLDENINPTSIQAGGTISVSCRVKNDSSYDADDSGRVGYYLSTDDSFDSSDILLDYSNFGYLDANEYSDENASLTIPTNTTAGTYYILFYADYQNNIDESSDNNNIETQQISITNSQNLTYVPDDNFEYYLETHDTSGNTVPVGDTNSMGNGILNDDYILTSRISNVTYLDVGNQNISDLTGIEDFDSVTYLYCNDNPLGTLDISSMVSIYTLVAYNCQLTSFTNTTRSGFGQLDIRDNNLTQIDVSSNTYLTYFNVSNNNITDINLTNNSNLEIVYVSNNDLVNFDLRNGNNTNISDPSYFSAYNNPNLTCIFVDDASWSSANWPDIDSNSHFVETQAECDAYNQTTYVPDDNFEQALIDLGYDSGALDDYVLTSNIVNVTHLVLSSKNINDLTGIEDFTSLIGLVCSDNNLTSIDISQNLSLKELYCSDNYLTSINVSNNNQLEEINLSNNSLSSLDLSNNSNIKRLMIIDNNITNFNSIIFNNNNSLTHLFIQENLINSLDLSSFINLNMLNCSNCNLSYLNLNNNNNQNLQNLWASNNSNLFCIQVDDETSANNGNGVYSNWVIDPWASYSENCNTGINDSYLSQYISISPNPTNQILNINNPLNIKLIQIKISNGIGQTIYKSYLIKNKMDISNFSNGIYFMELKDEHNRKVVYKIIKIK